MLLHAEDYLANVFADAAADAKGRSLVNTAHALHIEQAESIAFLIAMRLAALEAEYRETLPEKVWVNAAQFNEPKVETAGEYSAEALQAIREKGHNLCKRGVFMVCTHCRSRRKPGNHNKWIQEQCPGVVKVEVSTDSARLDDNAKKRDEHVEEKWIQVSRATAKKLRKE